MIVTDIVPIDRKKKRVCIDHDYAFPLYLSELRKFHIEEGAEISDHTMEEIHSLLYSRLKERVLFYITDADHSERDIRRKMRSALYPEDIIDEVIQKLKAVHYIDDQRFASTYIESMMAQKKSCSYIINKLYEKGVNKDLIDTLIEEYDWNELPLIQDAIRKKGYSPDDISNLPLKEKQRLYAYLLRKGFKMSDIGKALLEADYEANF